MCHDDEDTPPISRSDREDDRWRDDEEDRPRRRRRDDDDADDDRPRRRRRYDDDYDDRGSGTKTSTIVIIVGAIVAVMVCGGIAAIGLLLPAVQKVGEAAGRVQSTNNLKQLGLAIHNYHDVKDKVPPAAITDKAGKPLLSWRVAILPYIEEGALYQQFHLDEPWDGPNNSRLMSRMPKTLASLNFPEATAENKTPYRVFVGKKTPFEPGTTLSLKDFPNPRQTILIVEAAEAVPWTKPQELDYRDDGPLPPLWSGNRPLLAAMADASVEALPKETPEREMRSRIELDVRGRQLDDK